MNAIDKVKLNETITAYGSVQDAGTMQANASAAPGNPAAAKQILSSPDSVQLTDGEVVRAKNNYDRMVDKTKVNLESKMVPETSEQTQAELDALNGKKPVMV